MGFEGEIWPVHPYKETIAGLKCYKVIADLPSPPDAVFVGVNRLATLDIVDELSRMGAGGVICFASGFSEATAEDSNSSQLEHQLLQAAGDMPLLGPNCYGLINYLDGALLWPDQHGGQRVGSGVAIIAQSSNVALNLTMQSRGLPIAYVITVGNQAQISIGDLVSALLEDDRVSALGLYVEGFNNISLFEAMAEKAQRKKKPIIALKTGKTVAAQQALISHTNSLCGSDSAASAFLNRLGIARVHTLTEFLESLKFLHIAGPLKGNAIQSMSCSGGEASLMADALANSELEFSILNCVQKKKLTDSLGSLVALANPLDYNTYIWGDKDKLSDAFSAMLGGPASVTILIIDFPKDGRCDPSSWHITIEALQDAKQQTDSNTVCVLATMPENMPEALAEHLCAQGIVPFVGIEDAIRALEAAWFIHRAQKRGIPEHCMPAIAPSGSRIILDEATGKQMLSAHGLQVPFSVTGINEKDLLREAKDVRFPVVLKALGVAHKTESNAVKLGLLSYEEVRESARAMKQFATGFLLEEYIDDNIAELLVSIVHDPVHGYLLTLASGGVLTELLNDSVNLLLPVDEADVQAALKRLKIIRVLEGYRGNPSANLSEIINSVLQLQAFVIEHQEHLLEAEINPLICGEKRAVVADALIVFAGESE